MNKLLYIIVFQFFTIAVFSQYAPAAGLAGSTAIHMDSAIFVGWATNAFGQLGWQNQADTNLGRANYGTYASALGKADNDVVSLGDGGVAILNFANPIRNEQGWDFAVFENSFDGAFLELAFVEVSSDGQNYIRFPAHSLTQTLAQIQAFDSINPQHINNLAGKYKGGYGTPFDLEELIHFSSINTNQITHIRIVDVVGSLNPIYASIDTAANRINDPWPTAFSSSGFDLDAVGVLHQSVGLHEIANSDVQLLVFPNPAGELVQMVVDGNSAIHHFEIFTMQGQLADAEIINSFRYSYNSQYLMSGIYSLVVTLNSGTKMRRKVVIQ